MNRLVIKPRITRMARMDEIRRLSAALWTARGWRGEQPRDYRASHSEAATTRPSPKASRSLLVLRLSVTSV